MAVSRRESVSTQAFLVIDALLVWAAFLAGGELREAIHDWFGLGTVGEDLGSSMIWVLSIGVPFTPLALERFGFYSRISQKTTLTAVRQLVKGLLLITLIIGAITLFAKLNDARRLILTGGIGFIFVFLLVRDRLTSIWLRKRCESETRGERVVIAGSGEEIEELLAELDEEAISDWRIVERFDLRSRTVDELFELIKNESIGRVIFSAKHTEFEKVARAVEACELQGVEAWIAASFIRTQIARPVFDAIGSKPMLVLRSTPELSWELLFKAMFDRLAAFFLILLTFPIWIFAMLGIRFQSPGASVFFSQMRAGSYGRPFQIWKFRTMVANAPELLANIKAEHGNQMDGPVFKLDHDPRIFPFGAFLRKWSIDELPQLLNVLLGDMSLVGPRPLPLYEVEAFGKLAYRRRLSVKPGITCEWQVGGRNNITSFDDWVKMDLRYIDNWSIWLDMMILLKTIPAVLFGKGAK